MKRVVMCYILWGFVLSAMVSQAQYAENARGIIEELSSPTYSGRGYVRNGHSKAASYIAKQLRLSDYDVRFQPVVFPVVTFPGNVFLSINNSACIPGSDFVVSPSCPSVKGAYDVVSAPFSVIRDSVSLGRIIDSACGKFLLFARFSAADTSRKLADSMRTSISKMRNTQGIGLAGILLHDTLMVKWGVSQHVATIPVVYISKNMDARDIKNITVDIESRKREQQQSRNVIGMMRGSLYPDSFIVITAHYDHLGMMGKALFPGANDNASGVAMMLSLARYYALHHPRFSVVCIAFTGEEVGLIGSKYYVENPLFPLGNISFLLNLDMVATGSEGIKVVNGSNLKHHFSLLRGINDSLRLLPKVEPRVQGCISDQCYFYKAGVPCFFIYTMGGSKHYHDVYDCPAAISSLSYFDNLARLIISFIDNIANK